MCTMAEFLAYVHGLRREIDSFLETTRLRAEPSRAMVACGYCPQHFVLVESLATHARKCHGDRYYYEKHDSHAFFYQNNAHANTTATTDTMLRLRGAHEPQDPPSDSISFGDDAGSLVEAVAASEAAPLSSDPSSVLDAITALAPHTSALYAIVQNWRRIPRVFARLSLSVDIEASGPLRAKLERWIQHEIARLSSGDDVDADLVEYVLGLLDHPEFCHPDLIVVELEEFLGATDVRAFVLALWKFAIIEIGIQILPAAPLTSVDQSPAGTGNAAAPAGPKPPPPVAADAKRLPTVTRRRPTYRAKATRAGPYDVVREILAKSMAQLSDETGRELATEPTTPATLVVETREHSRRLRTPVENWTEYTDALSVRDMARPRMSRRRSRSPSRGPHRPRRRRRDSRSRSRSRSPSRDRPSRQRSDRDRDSGISRSGWHRSHDRRQHERRTY